MSGPSRPAILPDDIRQQLPGVTDLYAIHHEEGERLAWSRTAQWPLSWRGKMIMHPVSVH
jgi:hypothetical protein